VACSSIVSVEGAIGDIDSNTERFLAAACKLGADYANPVVSGEEKEKELQELSDSFQETDAYKHMADYLYSDIASVRSANEKLGAGGTAGTIGLSIIKGLLHGMDMLRSVLP
jgi:hypothetical protein